MYDFSSLPIPIKDIEAKLGYKFRNRDLLSLAFVHRSFVNENRSIINEHNERLEFLGDSVLGLVVSELLYKEFPEKSEGELSSLRSRIVEASSCMVFVQKLSLEQYLLLSRGEKMNGGRGRDSILADLFEALLCAIFLDGGFSAAKAFFCQHFLDEVLQIVAEPQLNHKAALQDFSQKKFGSTPVYKVLGENGPDHSKTFEVGVFLGDQEWGTGKGSSKKEAQQSAAEDALNKISEE